ncbi:MAG: phenylacetate--CoA ligase family protein [Desulfomonile sp.]|jgi:phenylacetate-CoA ligase|nr:phenylacetate--CoA ligase family protein [Deltaproteobacteria bacterium]
MIAYLKTYFKKSAPPILKTLETCYHLIPASLRYGKPYRNMMELYRKSDNWSEKEFQLYQEIRLRSLIQHAYANVPYYRQLFDEHHIEPEDIRTLDDLKKIPLLTANIIKDRREDLVATNISHLNREMSHTSGSTGPSMYFYFDKTTIPVERAQAMRHLLWLGYKNGDKIAVIKGQPLSEPRNIFKYYPGSKELRISLVNSDDHTMAAIVDELERVRPNFLRGWPSCLYMIARWMSSNNRHIAPPKFVITSSENLYLYMKKRIENVFGAKVIDGYGQSEFVAYALQCRYGKGYHVQMETGILELLPYRGQLSEIVGTCLWNFAMPFIRYQTEDLAIRQEEPCLCGRRSWLLAEVIGRTSDLIIRDEKAATRNTLSQCSFYDLEDVKETQILLEDDNLVRVMVVPRKEVSAALRESIVQEIQKSLGPSSMNVIVEEVDEIPPVESGKRPLIIGRSPSL